MPLFRTGNGSDTDTVIIALELVNPDWFRRNLIGALELMCKEENWEQVGDATIAFARDKANEMLEGIMIDVKLRTYQIGEIAVFAGEPTIAGWLACDGAAISRTTYADLFALIGENYGQGDNSTTFNLPDMKNKSPVGVGGSTQEGVNFGASSQVLSSGQMPAHNHAITDPGHTHRERVSTGANASIFTTAGGGNPTVASSPTTGAVALETGSKTTGIATQNTGGGGSVDMYHPVMAIPYYIFAGI